MRHPAAGSSRRLGIAARRGASHRCAALFASQAYDSDFADGTGDEGASPTAPGSHVALSESFFGGGIARAPSAVSPAGAPADTAS